MSLDLNNEESGLLFCERGGKNKCEGWIQYLIKDLLQKKKKLIHQRLDLLNPCDKYLANVINKLHLFCFKKET